MGYLLLLLEEVPCEGINGEMKRSLVVRLSDAFETGAKVEQYLASVAALQDVNEFERLGIRDTKCYSVSLLRYRESLSERDIN